MPLQQRAIEFDPGGLVAHPLLEHSDGFSPLLVTVLVLAVVLTVATRRSPARGSSEAAGERSPAPLDSWAGSLSIAQVVTRSVAVAVLLLAVVAGRFGSPDQLRNIAPALVIGAAWPLLVLGSALLGPVWRWVDPWDGLARFGARGESHDPAAESESGPENVWPAFLPALLWVWYLSVFAGSLDPPSVGAALAIYTVVTVAGCLAFGRKRWLSRVEVFGLLFGWIARVARGVLPTWRPPPGAQVVLGVLAGGLLFGALRRTSLWGALNVAPLALAYATAGLVASCALVAGGLSALERWSDRLGAAGTVTAASVPAVASLVVAFGLARNRLFTSVQLLPARASDPFGLGWDLFGTADWTLNPDPLGHVGLPLLQIGILLVGHVAGAWILTRRSEPPERRAGTVALGMLVALAAFAVTVT
ncbi:MAG: hypothetical protein ACRDIX_01145 [Actinomycetota bacterium]